MMMNFGLLLLLRVVPALMMIPHGWGKLAGFSQYVTQFPPVFGLPTALALSLAIFGEFICPILLILGVGTRLVAIPAATTMLVAAFLIHANDPWAKQEFPLLYAVTFLVLVFTGGGEWGLGNRFKPIWLKS